MFKKVMIALVVCFACVQMAQAASSLGFDVARSAEEIQQLAALSNADLAEHLAGLSGDQVAEQIEVLNDGRHGILLARILTALAKNIENFGDEGQRNSLVETLNGLGLPFSFNVDGNGKVSINTPTAGSGETPFLTGNDFPNPAAVSAGAIR